MNQSLDKLFRVNETNQHSIVMITCNNPEFKDLENSVTLHSENIFTTAFTNNVIYYLFMNQKKGHMFFKFNDTLKSCGILNIYNVSSTMEPLHLVKDFIVNSEKSIFKLSETPNKSFRIDCSMHGLLKK